MCCFSGPVQSVSNTSVFARATDGGHQVLVYEMTFASSTDVAMVLPIPTPPASAEDAVRFVSLEHCADFFGRLRIGFPDYRSRVAGGPQSVSRGPGPKRLVVRRVGDFEASFVPTVSDFERLDPRFQLSAAVWDQLPSYADWGFAVFKLRAARSWWRRLIGGAATRRVHPMAFLFPSRDPARLFFPTVHVHDGVVAASARFDHDLYCQPSALMEPTLAWRRSTQPAGDLIGLEHCGELVAPESVVLRRQIAGEQPNRDTWLESPTVSSVEQLVRKGHCFRLRVMLTAIHEAEAQRTDTDAQGQYHTARYHAEELGDRLTSALEALARDHEDDWGLQAPSDAAETFEFGFSSDVIETQYVTFGFSMSPPGDLYQEIHAALHKAAETIEIEHSQACGAVPA